MKERSTLTTQHAGVSNALYALYVLCSSEQRGTTAVLARGTPGIKATWYMRIRLWSYGYDVMILYVIVVPL